MTTSSHPITVDGEDLQTWAWNIVTKKGWDAGLSVVGGNESVAGMDGELWTPNKNWGAGKFIVSMWVSGTDDEGLPPVHGDGYAQYRQNLDRLRRLFGVRHRLLDVRQDLGPLGIRQAFCEVLQSIDPDYPGRTLGKFDVLFDIPGAFWQDPNEVLWDSGAGVALGSKALNGFAGATAPMKDLWLVFDGPWTNPRVTDDATGHYVQLNMALPVGQQWVVKVADRSSRTGIGIEFTEDGAQHILETTKGGAYAPGLFGLTPSEAAPTVTLGGSGLGASSRFRIRGFRKYQ